MAEHRDRARSWLRGPAWRLAARAALAAVFVYSGTTKALDFEAAVAETAGFGLPAPVLLAAATIAVQLGGAALVLAGGRAAALGAALLAGFTLAASAVAHGFWSMDGVARVRALTTFLEHVGLVGGFLLLARAELEERRP